MTPALTNTQLLSLKALIAATPAMASKPNNSDGDFDIAALLNLDATPAFQVWKTTVTIDEIMLNGFDLTSRIDRPSTTTACVQRRLSKNSSPLAAEQRQTITASALQRWPQPARSLKKK